MSFLPVDILIQLAVQEDLGHGDVTTEAVVSAESLGKAVVLGREPFVLSGTVAFRRVFETVDPSVEVKARYRDGDEVPRDEPVFEIQGRLRSLLTGERTALNFIQRLSGIATLTRRMTRAIEGTGSRLLDTRKTTPLWRALEKAAVRHGGGGNHRFGLSDGILIKDNHIQAAGGIRPALELARSAAAHTLRVEIEVEDLHQLGEALDAGADIIMLDNFSIEMLKAAVERSGGRCLLEASGGVDASTVRQIAETGVHLISCGALTHSARSIDISMELC
ncbi:MAG: carboxylating nicotinate-nucleotide diphosphorylase [Syntrophobacteraceae bacterium]|nr:carboxylating nicotinate-nucleotide diphosphorylase [Syntrophobacteraceae bacterium]